MRRNSFEFRNNLQRLGGNENIFESLTNIDFVSFIYKLAEKYKRVLFFLTDEIFDDGLIEAGILKFNRLVENSKEVQTYGLKPFRAFLEPSSKTEFETPTYEYFDVIKPGSVVLITIYEGGDIHRTFKTPLSKVELTDEELKRVVEKGKRLAVMATGPFSPWISFMIGFPQEFTVQQWSLDVSFYFKHDIKHKNLKRELRAVKEFMMWFLQIIGLIDESDLEKFEEIKVIKKLFDALEISINVSRRSKK